MPPLVGVAVKVTELPEHTVVCVAAMLRDGVTAGFTVIVTVLLVAVVGDAHAAFEVSTQVKASPFAIVLVV